MLWWRSGVWSPVHALSCALFLRRLAHRCVSSILRWHVAGTVKHFFFNAGLFNGIQLLMGRCGHCFASESNTLTLRNYFLKLVQFSAGACLTPGSQGLVLRFSLWGLMIQAPHFIFCPSLSLLYRRGAWII